MFSGLTPIRFMELESYRSHLFSSIIHSDFSQYLLFFAYIGGYSTNIGVHKHIPAAAEGLQYPFIFAYIGGYSTNIGFLKDM